MAILKDGIYEAEDLFYADGGFTVAVSGGGMEFFRGAGPVNRLKLAASDPNARLLRLGEPVRAPAGVTSGRCEFDKSLVKTVLSAGTESELARRLGGMTKALAGCSLFESAFVMDRLSDGGLVFTVQDGGAPAAKSPAGVKPGRAISALCRIVLNDPGYPEFRRSLAAKFERGDPEDIRLHRQLTKTPYDLKAVWEWTEADSEECLAILKAKPFFRECLYARSD
jgi:hypothetical protein